MHRRIGVALKRCGGCAPLHRRGPQVYKVQPKWHVHRRCKDIGVAFNYWRSFQTVAGAACGSAHHFLFFHILFRNEKIVQLAELSNVLGVALLVFYTCGLLRCITKKKLPAKLASTPHFRAYEMHEFPYAFFLHLL